MASKDKETRKITLPSGNLSSTIKLSTGGGLKKEDVMKKIAKGENKNSFNLITRKGENEPNVGTIEESSGLSFNEKQRRIRALEQDAAKPEMIQPELIKKPKGPSVAEMAVESDDEEALKNIEPQPKQMSVSEGLSESILKTSVDIEISDSSFEKPKNKRSATATEAPLFVFKQGDTVSSIDEIMKTAEPVVKVDKRDKTLLDKMMKHYKYLEFDSDKEIETLQQGLELRSALEEKRKGNSGSEEEVVVQISVSESEEDVLKIRREAYFSRHNKKPSKRRMGNLGRQAFVPKEVEISDKNLVLNIAKDLGVKVEEVIKKLRTFSIIVKPDSIIDGDSAELAVEEMGHIVKRVKKVTAEDKLIKVANNENLLPVDPVVTVMGHVDHGKTSLLDALRKTNVASKEAGGITQHIGAYQTVLENGKKITFIDTPGHEAFTAIRARGANSTHVVILVVAADDSVMPQTLEAISHAKAAGVPIVIAINKIDKPGANIEKVKNDLLVAGIISEDLGGDAIIVPVSAKNGKGLEELCNAVLLQAEILDIRADYSAHASGVVLEGKLDKQKGVVASFLVQNGTLQVGDMVVVGLDYFKVRMMVNDRGENVKSAPPSMPVEVYGLGNVPIPGTSFNVVESEKIAKEISSHRKDKKAEMESKTGSSFSRAVFDDFFKNETEKKKEVNFIIRADVQSTVEAIKNSINSIKLPAEITLNIMQATVGNVTEADITLAKTKQAVIFSFGLRLGSKEEESAKKNGVTIKEHTVIYTMIDDVKDIISGQLSPIIREENIGEAEVREVFDVSKAGKIAGCSIKKGVAQRGAFVKVLRQDAFIFEGKLKTLKHFKEDVKELSMGNECGIQIEGFEDFAPGDVLQIVKKIEERRTI